MKEFDLSPYSDGCEVHPHCLECPLPECRFDNSYWYTWWKRGQRNEGIVKAVTHEGLSVRDTAEEFSLSERSVNRIVAQYQSDETLSKRSPG
jgi:hypothetical protein